MKTRNRKTGLVLALALVATLAAGAPDPAHAQSAGLDISQARLQQAFYPGPRTPGRYAFRALLNDASTGGLFFTELLAGTIVVELSDASGFGNSLSVTIENCRRNANGARCIFRTPEGFRVAAFAKRFRNVPDVFIFAVRVRDLQETDTGFGPLAGPVTLSVIQSTVTRTDTTAAGDCIVRDKGGALRCKDRS